MSGQNNPARSRAEALANLAKSYLKEGAVEKTHVAARQRLEAQVAAAAEVPPFDAAAEVLETKFLSLDAAAEALPLDVEAVTQAIERLYPGADRAAAMARAGLVRRLANVVASACIIGTWHADGGAAQKEAWRALGMADAMKAVRKGKDTRFERLVDVVRQGHTQHAEIRKAFGCVGDKGYPSESVTKRAVALVKRERKEAKLAEQSKTKG
jgi:hypothetical protein